MHAQAVHVEESFEGCALGAEVHEQLVFERALLFADVIFEEVSRAGGLKRAHNIGLVFNVFSHTLVFGQLHQQFFVQHGTVVLYAGLVEFLLALNIGEATLEEFDF